MSQLPHIPLTRSKLEAYRTTIHQIWLKETSVLEISRILAESGCTIGRTRISTWIDNEVKVGRFPKRTEPFVGRPKKNRPQPALAPPLPFEPDDFREMEGFLRAVAQQIRPKELAAQLAIPFSELGDPDYGRYAQCLGKGGVSRLGKMDYILLGMCSVLLMITNPQDNPKFIEMVCKGAESIRTRILAAVTGAL